VKVSAGLLTDKHKKSAAMVAIDREIIVFSFELLYRACRQRSLGKEFTPVGVRFFKFCSLSANATEAVRVPPN